MNTDIKSLIPSMHAELKRMQSRVAELQVSLQQGSSDEKGDSRGNFSNEPASG